MSRLYIAVGHGLEPNGVWDPGAVSGHLVEHTLARQVVIAMTDHLRQAGFDDFTTNEGGGRSHTTDYRGTIDAARKLGCEDVCEVHFNASGASGEGHGCEVLYCPHIADGEHWAEVAVEAVASALGLANRGTKQRCDLALLTEVSGHAIIPEIAFIDGDAELIVSNAQSFCERAGKALASSYLAVIGWHVDKPASWSVSIEHNGEPRGDATSLAEAANAVAGLLAEKPGRYAVKVTGPLA